MYTGAEIKLKGKITLFIVHPDTKKPVETVFYITEMEGSTLLSCKTTLTLNLIEVRKRADAIPPRSRLVHSAADAPPARVNTATAAAQETAPAAAQ